MNFVFQIATMLAILAIIITFGYIFKKNKLYLDTDFGKKK